MCPSNRSRGTLPLFALTIPVIMAEQNEHGTWFVPARGWQCTICMEEMVRRSCMEEPGTPQPVEMMCCKRTKNKGAHNYCYLCYPCLLQLLRSDTTRCPLCKSRLNWVKTAREKGTLISQTLQQDMLLLLQHFPHGFVPDEEEEKNGERKFLF